MTNVTLVILAGGEGRRMGMAKGLLRLGDRPILDYLLDRIAWPGPTVLVTAPGREHPPSWERFSREVIDPVAGTGPLRGLLTALEHLSTEHAVITTVDMPNVTRSQLQWLAETLAADRERLGVMLSRRDTGTGPRQIEPFPCAFSARAMDLVRDHLASGARSVYSLAGKPGIDLVPTPADWSEETWVNLNLPEDVDRLRS